VGSSDPVVLRGRAIAQRIAGDSPVRDSKNSLVRHLSRTGHVKAGLNLRGPSRKAKYSLATDSEPSSASERWEEPLPGEDSEPETTCLQAIGARLGMAIDEERGQLRNVM